MDELIRPNWHMAVVHFPIALLAIGTLVEVFSFLGWRRSGFRWAGRWMLLLGAMLAVPATFLGLYAMADVVPQGIEGLRITNPAAAETLSDHLWLQAGSTLVAMFVVTLWIACADRWRDRLSLPLKLVLLLMLGAQLAGAHHGGELVYVHGVGVEKGIEPAQPTTRPTVEQLGKLSTWETLLPPVQSHVALAGLAMAMACVCLGLNVRAIAQDDDLTITEEAQTSSRIAAAFAREQGDLKQLLAADDEAVSLNHTPAVRAGRYWLLALLGVIATSALGWWTLATYTDSWTVTELWEAIKTPIEDTDPALTRRLAHVASAAVIIVSTLLLSLTAMVARKSRFALVLFGLPLILALVAQVWLGTLLLLDGPAGSVTSFSTPLMAPSTEPS